MALPCNLSKKSPLIRLPNPSRLASPCKNSNAPVTFGIIVCLTEALIRACCLFGRYCLSMWYCLLCLMYARLTSSLVAGSHHLEKALMEVLLEQQSAHPSWRDPQVRFHRWSSPGFQQAAATSLCFSFASASLQHFACRAKIWLLKSRTAPASQGLR